MMILNFSKGLVMEQAVKFGFLASNNKAEYKVLILGLRLPRNWLSDPSNHKSYATGNEKNMRHVMRRCLNEDCVKTHLIVLEV